MEVDPELVSVVLNFILAVASIVFARQYKKFKEMFLMISDAIKDDKVTEEEVREIIEKLEE